MEQLKNQGKHTLYLQLSGITRTTSITNIVADRIGKTTHNNVLFFHSSNSIRLPLTPKHITSDRTGKVACKYSDAPW